MEEYFDFLVEPVFVLLKNPLTRENENFDIIVKILQSYNFGEFDHQDFLKLREVVLKNIGQFQVVLEKTTIDRRVLLRYNKLSFIAKWNEMEKMLLATRKLATLEERLKIEDRKPLEDLSKIKF